MEGARKSGQRTIRTRDHNLKLITPLSRIRRLGRIYRHAPQRALIVRSRGRIRAVVGVGVDGGVALEIDVEGLAAGRLVAFRGAG